LAEILSIKSRNNWAWLHQLVRDLSRIKGALFGRSFWARGYCVSTICLDESAIRQYIQDQEQHQQNEEQDELNIT
jgi:REP element-mobilizing transposase RayT